MQHCLEEELWRQQTESEDDWRVAFAELYSSEWHERLKLLFVPETDIFVHFCFKFQTMYQVNGLQ